MNWLMQLISRLPISPALATKLASFATIGVGNTLVDFVVFTFAIKILGWPLVPANVLSWLVAVSVSYVMNSLITFHAESGRALHLKGFFTFVASGILGVVVSTTVLVLLSYVMPVFAAKFGAILTGFVVNFSMAHFVVFRTKPPEQT